MEKAILAGGCFWGMEDLIRKAPGVVDTEVGYTGGNLDHPRYEDVKTGETGHAEAIEISFDPRITSYEEILKLFFQIHDPTTLNRQGNDVGSQYRSTIFYTDDAQKMIAEDMVTRANASGIWEQPVATTIEPASKFWPAEAIHQDYLETRPQGYTCHFPRADWVIK